MSNLKRFLAMSLAILMIVSGLAISTSALKYADVSATDNAELAHVVDVLSDLGVIKGTSAENFTPDRAVNRQEFALFMARIHSATPQYFYADETIPAPFPDCEDPTFFSAIDYCVKNDIINGYEDGTFKPTATVKFQEAVKMMVSALGHIGLAYPNGYLSKAYDIAEEVNIIEPNGTTGEFLPTRELSRGDVALLLYNYFLSSYSKVIVAYNPVLQRYENAKDLSPVCEKFGISKIVGYVTGIQGFAANIYDKDTNATITGKPLTVKEAKLADITISYNRYISTPTAGNPTATTLKQFDSKKLKAELGIADIASENLLGLKVVTYENISTTTKKIKIPAIKILGTKTELAKDKISASNVGYDGFKTTIGGKIVANVNTNPTFTLDGAVYEQSAPMDLDIFTKLYSWENTNTMRTGLVSGTDKAAMLYNGESIAANPNFTLATIYTQQELQLDLAFRLKEAGEFKLEYVDNGLNRDGSVNNYYIYTPFSVGVYKETAADTGIKKFYTSVGTNLDGSNSTVSDVGNNVIFKDSTITALAAGEGYLYYYKAGSNAEVNHLEIYKQLTRTKLALADVVYYNNVMFTNVSKSAYFSANSNGKAINAFHNSEFFTANSYYDIYALNGQIIFAKKGTGYEAPAYRPNYAVIASNSAGSNYTIQGTDIVALLTVYDITSKKDSLMVVKNVNGVKVTGPIHDYSARLGIPGTYGEYFGINRVIAYEGTLADASIYSESIPNPLFGQAGQDRFIENPKFVGTGYKGSVYPDHTFTAAPTTVLNVSGSELIHVNTDTPTANGLKDHVYYSTVSGVMNFYEANGISRSPVIIDNDSKIVLVSYNGNGAWNSTYNKSTAITKSQFDAIIGKTVPLGSPLTTEDVISRIAVVTTNPGTATYQNVGKAAVVYIAMNRSVLPAQVGQYVIATGKVGFAVEKKLYGNTVWYTRDTYDYVTGTPMKVGSTSVAATRDCNILYITGEIFKEIVDVTENNVTTPNVEVTFYKATETDLNAKTYPKAADLNVGTDTEKKARLYSLFTEFGRSLPEAYAASRIVATKYDAALTSIAYELTGNKVGFATVTIDVSNVITDAVWDTYDLRVPGIVEDLLDGTIATTVTASPFNNATPIADGLDAPMGNLLTKVTTNSKTTVYIPYGVTTGSTNKFLGLVLIEVNLVR